MLEKSVQAKLLRSTESLCPECFRVIPAQVFSDIGGIVKICKTCTEHGYYEDTYTFSDLKLYKWAELYAHEGVKPENPRKDTVNGCPYDCGLCPQHSSQTVLAIIDVTNRCNMRCPICFANAASTGYVYEPTREQIGDIMKNLRATKPVPPPALQFSGGEPTMRDDLPELIAAARDIGFRHIEVNTNGIRFASDTSFIKRCVDAGMSTVYLQFDGLDDEIYRKSRGVPMMDVKLKFIEKAREIGFESIVLVVTLVKGLNDHQQGDIIRFAMKNSDVVRCVNVQPVSITGRIDKESREAMRMNTTDFMKLIESQTDGNIKVSDFRPVPSVIPISEAIGALKGKRYVEFSTAPWCGVATFMIQKREGNWIPITELVDVDKFFKAMKKIAEEAKSGKRLSVRMRTISSLRHVKANFIKDVVWPVLKEGSYKALGGFMRKVIMIGCMHFMDPYNFDLYRVNRCTIHYGLPDGTIRSFCSYNTLHRKDVEAKFSTPYREWLRKYNNQDKVFQPRKAS